MRILTLDEKNFGLHCRMLEARVLTDGYEPDLIVGIAPGGAEVAEQIFEGVPHVTLDLNLPYRDRGQHGNRPFIDNLPAPLANGLLIAESLLFTFKNHGLYPVQIPEGLEQYKRILVVDDTVNSGSTLASVMSALGDRCRAAAIALSSVRTPIIHPHYYIYKNPTLIRLPRKPQNSDK